MITCPSCGKLNDDTSRHCGFCGVRLVEPEDTRRRTMLGMAIPFNNLEEDDDEETLQTPPILPKVTSLNPKLDGIPHRNKIGLRQEEDRPKATLIMSALPFADDMELPDEIPVPRPTDNPLLTAQPTAQKMLTLDGWPSPIRFDPEESVSESQDAVLSPPTDEAPKEHQVAFEDTAPSDRLHVDPLEPATIDDGDKDGDKNGDNEDDDEVLASISSPDQPAIRSPDALADTLEANRLQMHQAMSKELPPEAKSTPVEKPATVPAAQMSPDIGVSGQQKDAKSPRNTLREASPVLPPAPQHTEMDESPKSFRFVQWALIIALVVVVGGIAALSAIYYFLD